MKAVAAILLALFIGLGRLSISNRPLLMSWDAWYEALAHIALGALICLGFWWDASQATQPASKLARVLDNPILWAAVSLTLLETVLVLMGPYSPLN